MVWAILLCTLAAAAAVQGVHSIVITITPWCRDSFRVQVTTERGASALSSGALINTTCQPGTSQELSGGAPAVQNGNLKVTRRHDGALDFSRADTGASLFVADVSLAPSSREPGFWAANATLRPGDRAERIYGLGQGNWTNAGGTAGGCATKSERVVPLERNGQTVNLLQRKFHVSIPFAYSSAGYGFLFNMPGYGSVAVGGHGEGGMAWHAEAAPLLDFWVTTGPSGHGAASPQAVYEHYADATGHAPMLREDAMIFWQSRLRYMNSTVALAVATRYQDLNLPVGVLVVDYYNQVLDGDFQPDPRCYPSLKSLSDGIREKLNASTIFSIWPEAKKNSGEYDTLQKAGCLINSDLGGLAMDATSVGCRKLIWEKFVKPRYFDQGVTAYWLDETDGEGTAGGDGNHGYDTSYGPASVASNLWVNDWLRTFTEPVAAQGVAPLVLTRGVWAGGQRHGIVLWSSDIESTFEELTAQVPLGVHSSLSGIPWWTSDVGGFGCGSIQPNESPYMQELIVRWYQFGLFCPIFRTHGCRKTSRPTPRNESDPCFHGTGSCAGNEVWSYGSQTQALLEHFIRLRASLKPYIYDLAQNVTSYGVPTMRPLWWEFPDDPDTIGINDQYMLGPELLVAPVTTQGAISRSVYFPAGAYWRSFFNRSEVLKGGATRMVSAPLSIIPVYERVRSETDIAVQTLLAI